MTRSETVSNIGRRAVFTRTDTAGLLLATTFASWLVIVSWVSGGSAAAPVALSTGAAVAFAIGQLVGGRWTIGPAVIVVIIVAISIVWAWPDVVGEDPHAGPLGYQNANGALVTQALVAALMAFMGSSSLRVKVAMTVIALVCVSLLPAIGSTAAVGGASVVVVSALLTGVPRWRSRVIAALGIGFTLGLVTTIALGWTHQPRTGAAQDGVVASGLTETRLALWHDALRLTGMDPLFGVGVGRFEEESPVAQADRDRSTAHNEFLQVSAETGVVGGLLLTAIFVWVITRVGLTRTGGGVIAAAGATALGLQGSVDYILHFPVVPIASAFLAGAVVSRDGLRSGRPGHGALERAS